MFHGSFEKPHHVWTVVRGAASPDTSVLHGSNRSLRVEPGSSSSDAAVWSEGLGLDYRGTSFRIDGQVHACEREALLLASVAWGRIGRICPLRIGKPLRVEYRKRAQ